MQEKEISKRLYSRDPLLVLLLDKWNVNQAGILIIIAILWVMITAIPWLTGKAVFNINNFGIDLTEAFVIFPIGITVYFGVPKFLATLFMELGPYVGESRKQPEESYDQFIASLIQAINNPAWIIIAILTAALYWIYRLSGNLTADFTRDLPQSFRLIYRLLLLTVYTPLIYGAVLSIIRIVIGVLFTGNLFRVFRIRTNPLNPDGVGGIGIVGRALSVGILVVTMLGIVATIMIYLSLSAGVNPFERVETIALGLLYIVLIPFVIRNWLWVPHQALLDAREQALLPLADEFKLAITGDKSLSGESTEIIRLKTERLIEIKKQYDLIQSTFPVWPLEVKPLRNLLATSILPAVSSLLSGPILELWKIINGLVK